jgi:sarcosine oxidase subunit gamma
MADPLPATPAVHDGVTIAAAPAAARYSLRTRSPEGLPPILKAAAYAEGHALGLGPDEWLLLLPDGAPPPAIEGVHALTDIGHRNVGFAIDGPNAAALLQRGVALDLALAGFPVGKVTRTLHEGVEVLLWRTGEARFHVEVWRSFAGHLFAALDLNAEDL